MIFDLWPLLLSHSINLLIFDLRMSLMIHHSMWSHLFLVPCNIVLDTKQRPLIYDLSYQVCINGSLTFDLRMSLMMHHSMQGPHSLVLCTYWGWHGAGFQAVVLRHSDWIDFGLTQAPVCFQIQQWEGRPCSSPNLGNVSGWSERKQGVINTKFFTLFEIYL